MTGYFDLAIDDQSVIGYIYVRRLGKVGTEKTHIITRSGEYILIFNGSKGSMIDCQTHTLPILENATMIASDHIAVSSGGNTIYAIIGGPIATDFIARIKKEKGSYFTTERTLFSGLYSLHSLASQGKDINSSAASMHIYHLLKALLRFENVNETTKCPSIVYRAIEVMRTNFAYIDHINEIAENLSVTPNYLIRRFKEAMGVTPGQYLTQIRIENAKLMMNTGVKQFFIIARSSGFTSDNYFRRVFKKETGMTITEYIKQVENKKKSS